MDADIAPDLRRSCRGGSVLVGTEVTSFVDVLLAGTDVAVLAEAWVGTFTATDFRRSAGVFTSTIGVFTATDFFLSTTGAWSSAGALIATDFRRAVGSLTVELIATDFLRSPVEGGPLEGELAATEVSTGVSSFIEPSDGVPGKT